MANNRDQMAFPIVGEGNQSVIDGGMTLLDYFAGQIMAGFAGKHNDILRYNSDADVAVRKAYVLAAAMLEQREKYLQDDKT